MTLCLRARIFSQLLILSGRANHMKPSDMKDTLHARWKAAHKACSIAALGSAFANCKDGDNYDLGKLYSRRTHMI